MKIFTTLGCLADALISILIPRFVNKLYLVNIVEETDGNTVEILGKLEDLAYIDPEYFRDETKVVFLKYFNLFGFKLNLQIFEAVEKESV